jgi:hypothetical protein
MKNNYITNLFLLAFITLSFTFSSCNYYKEVKGNGKIIKKEFQIKDFDKIELGGYYNVIISQGDKSKLEIETDENLMEYIEAKVSSKLLKIKNKKNIIASKNINVYLTINKLEELAISGYVRVSSADRLNFNKLSMAFSGNSEINMNINCVELKTEYSGNSNINLSGTSLTADMNASGSSVINATELLVDDLKFTASGNAVAKVNAISKLDVNISGSAQVEYYGSPDVKQTVSGSGIITKMY